MVRDNAPSISVVICTYERHALLPQTIARVLDQTLPADAYEVIVVDNSPNQTAAARFG
jgi:glycosyltransferase involved in cell wall biosynthesis